MIVCETRFALRAGAMRLHQSCVFLPPANETYAYDADGNQTLVTTGTGAWQVEYNGENRPVKWTRVPPDSTTPNSSTPTLVSMTFDHQGRRRLYVEVAAGVTNKLHRFTYDDYVCIARSREVDAQHGVGSDAFVWDRTEPIATRPLMCNPSTETPFFYCHDGNKNVSEIVSLYGTIAAHYEYSSFGKVVLVTSENEDQSTANLNPYRFSSEYADDALGLVYYNYRHYNPKDGRWTSRDKLEEPNKSVNSVCFASNNSIVDSDWIGLLSNPVEVDLNTAIKIFDDWYNNEKRNLEKRDRDGRNWVDYLPECPKELGKAGDKFVSPNSKEWKMSGKDGTSMLKFFHPGGAFELRTADPAKYGGSGNQCVYDECGKLITDLPSSGTVDFVSPTGDIGSVIGHFAADVLPFLYAKLIDNIRGDDSMEYVRRYYEVRPSR